MNYSICIVCNLVQLPWPKESGGSPKIVCDDCKGEYQRLYRKTWRASKKCAALVKQLTKAAEDLPYSEKAVQLENLIVGIRPAILVRHYLNHSRWESGKE